MNKTEGLSLIAIWVTFYVVIFNLSYPDMSRLLKSLCLTIICGVNFVFFINLFFLLYKHKIRVTLNKLINFFRKTPYTGSRKSSRSRSKTALKTANKSAFSASTRKALMITKRKMNSGKSVNTKS